MRLPCNITGMLWTVPIKPWVVCVLVLLQYSAAKTRHTTPPHVDCGDFVIVTNVDKIKFTGNKLEEKVYDRYSGYPGGRKEEIAKDLLKRRPEVIIERAVKGMLPKNRLGRKMYKKLFVYVGDQHPHTAQQPKELKF